MVNNWLNIIQHYLLPPTCILCEDKGIDSQDICRGCFNDLPINNNCCYQCAEPFNSEHLTPQLCGHCISHTPAFDNTYAPFIHVNSIRYLIASLKFKQHYQNARLLGTLLARYVEKSAKMPELIIPVPLHKKRYKERGFNQSFEIAKTLSKSLNIPLNNTACTRYRDTPHQINLPAKQRHQNIKNAFELNASLNAQHIAIVDDVFTTGSTVNELAKVLKKSGVKKIDIWVCARA